MSRFTFSNYEPTFNKAIDYCANIIACARENMTPIKALHLSTGYYEWFKGGMKAIIEKRGAENKEELIANLDLPSSMEFDGVNIEQAKFQTKPVVIEYYEPIAQA